ncbi:MAG: Butyryl-CoA dehydrogenase, partial [uncultured Thermoleophilia bacterium]
AARRHRAGHERGRGGRGHRPALPALRERRAPARRARLRRVRGVPAGAPRPGRGPRSHELRPARGLRRRRDHEPARRLSRHRGADVGRQPDRARDRPGRLLRGAAPRPGRRGAAPPLAARRVRSSAARVRGSDHGARRGVRRRRA